MGITYFYVIMQSKNHILFRKVKHMLTANWIDTRKRGRDDIVIQEATEKAKNASAEKKKRRSRNIESAIISTVVYPSKLIAKSLSHNNTSGNQSTTFQVKDKVMTNKAKHSPFQQCIRKEMEIYN